MPSQPDLPFLKLEHPGQDRCHALSELHSLSFDEGWSAVSMSGLFEQQNVFGLGCFDHDQICLAFALFLPIVDECELVSIATHPSRRNSGLGGRILKESLSHVCEKGFARILLEVAEDNLPARSLYTFAGFGVDGRRKGYYKRPDMPSVDAILMSKPI
jgi:ribosomal-protein-alanine N-acetyltransferase